MTNTESAWLAGLIDGEGAIWCRWPKRTNVIVEIKMCHKETVQRVNSLFPGRFAKGHLTANGMSRKEQWRWSLDTCKARELLVVILPYLVTKQEAAFAAIQLCTRPVMKDYMDHWAAKLKGLQS